MQPRVSNMMGHDYAAAWSTLNPDAVLAFFIDDEDPRAGENRNPRMRLFSGCHGHLHSGIRSEVELMMSLYAKLTMTCRSFEVSMPSALMRWTIAGLDRVGEAVITHGWDEWRLRGHDRIAYAAMYEHRQ